MLHQCKLVEQTRLPESVPTLFSCNPLAAAHGGHATCPPPTHNPGAQNTVAPSLATKRTRALHQVVACTVYTATVPGMFLTRAVRRRHQHLPWHLNTRGTSSGLHGERTGEKPPPTAHHVYDRPGTSTCGTTLLRVCVLVTLYTVYIHATIHLGCMTTSPWRPVDGGFRRWSYTYKCYDWSSCSAKGDGSMYTVY